MSLFVKLREDAVLPTRATKKSAGYDLHCIEPIYIRQQEWFPGPVLIKTGIGCNVPDGYCGQIWAKSGRAKQGVMKLAGLIDGDYAPPNELIVMLANLGPEDISYPKGKSIAQIVFVPYFSADESEVEGIRVGGFGSTDALTKVLMVDGAGVEDISFALSK